jgi:hypothetical protein
MTEQLNKKVPRRSLAKLNLSHFFGCFSPQPNEPSAPPPGLGAKGCGAV